MQRALWTVSYNTDLRSITQFRKVGSYNTIHVLPVFIFFYYYYTTRLMMMTNTGSMACGVAWTMDPYAVSCVDRRLTESTCYFRAP